LIKDWKKFLVIQKCQLVLRKVYLINRKTLLFRLIFQAKPKNKDKDKDRYRYKDSRELAVIQARKSNNKFKT